MKNAAFFQIYFLFFLAGWNISAQKVDWSGTWEGILQQKNGGVRPEYYFRMELRQDGSQIRGSSYISLPDDSTVFGRMLLSGSISGDAFTFSESKLAAENRIENMRWCIKNGTLRLKEESDRLVLTGNWAGDGKCPPGTLRISRRKVQKSVDTRPQTPSVTTNLPTRINQTVTLKNVIFAQGESYLLPASFPELDRLAAIMQRNPNMKILLKGHTDIIGNPDDNLQLSQQRVGEVKKYLSGKKIAGNRIQIKAFGGMQPLKTDGTDEERRINRRVEIMLLSQ
jgi:outer membrane protein OmpA-like peptidoglycan-associated protein